MFAVVDGRSGFYPQGSAGGADFAAGQGIGALLHGLFKVEEKGR